LPLESQGGMDADEIYTMWGWGFGKRSGDDKNALQNDLAACRWQNKWAIAIRRRGVIVR